MIFVLMNLFSYDIWFGTGLYDGHTEFLSGGILGGPHDLWRLGLLVSPTMLVGCW